MPKPKVDPKLDAQLVQDIAEFYFDPLGFIYYAWPWGIEGGPLEHSDGPDKWQAQICRDIGNSLRDNMADHENGVASRFAATSGHGSGKSALMSMLMQWWMSTRPNCRGIATAGTKAQIMTKLWPELALWHSRSINRHWFDWQATSFKSLVTDHGAPPDAWMLSAIPWNAQKPDSFAGLHSTAGVLVLFDEGSTIDQVIWDTVEGAMSEPGALWITFGNPVRSSGAFYDCFHKKKKYWKNYQIDTRTCKMVNQAQIREWSDYYGEDSDFFKVRVLGVFPSVASTQLIPTTWVERAASARHIRPPAEGQAARAMGIDLAREGDDQSVICIRDGNYVHPLIKYREPNSMVLASNIARHIEEWDPDAVFVDGVGIGGPIIDRLRQLGYDVIDVQAATTEGVNPIYKNKRAEMWHNLKDWYSGDVLIPDDTELKEDCTSMEFFYTDSDKRQLERNKDRKKRGLPSPDCGTALALTHAEPVRDKRLHGSVDRTSLRRDLLPRGSSWRLL